ncbi:hypothetical protein H6F76_17605 [Leptolyngbya sp. FACHB-321]|uniref:hypothetical protein n=1 Tax=Leptolyngbya sp. FACHB-321 TaxID=2692807 RepID=UPI001688C10E|nr:hypothetical protein [Leptolyngbya sp. FACHB-321]MBD2036827.1 hypothetical protein [Leptolyngbya sp. FACHB-321]
MAFVGVDSMAIAGRESVVPLELRLQRAKQLNARGLSSLLLTTVSVLKRVWWHTKSYLPIVGILLLAAGSLLLLQLHWLSRRLLQSPLREKAIAKDLG